MCTIRLLTALLFHRTYEVTTIFLVSVPRPPEPSTLWGETCMAVFQRPTTTTPWYAASAWNPNLAKDISQLESVQRHAARFAFARYDYLYSISVTNLLDSLNWALLYVRSTNSRQSTFHKAVSNRSAISTNHLKEPPDTLTKQPSYRFPSAPSPANTYSFLAAVSTRSSWH